jgi:hypothetical protein
VHLTSVKIWGGDPVMQSGVLVWLVVALLIGNALGLVISVAAGWPAEFGGVGDPENVLGEFPSRGTLLAAPIAPLIVLVVGLVLALRGNRWLASLGLLALVVVPVLFVIGTLGEPLRPQASDPPVAFLIVWRTVFIALSVALVVFAGLELWRRARGTPSAVSAR